MIVVCSSCSFERVGPPLEQPGNVASMPGKGDFWVCPRCGALHRFTGGMTINAVRCVISELHVRPAGEEELAELEEPLRSHLCRRRDQIRSGAPS